VILVYLSRLLCFLSNLILLHTFSRIASRLSNKCWPFFSFKISFFFFSLRSLLKLFKEVYYFKFFSLRKFFRECLVVNKQIQEISDFFAQISQNFKTLLIYCLRKHFRIKNRDSYACLFQSVARRVYQLLELGWYFLSWFIPV